MKAIVCGKYGGPETLKLLEVDQPNIKDDQVLIKTYASSVSAGDCRMRSFDVPPSFWLLGKLFLGWSGPRQNILGMELAGKVVETGKSVSKFKVGDRIYGTTSKAGFGGYAEFKCFSEKDAIVKIDDNLTFNKMAGVPIGAHTAWHFLKKGNIKKGDKVLIYGASGCVGLFAVQLAKYWGASVTAVCSGENHDLVKKQGANSVIDYQTTDLKSIDKNSYDIVFDAVGKISYSEIKQCIIPNGYFLSVVLSNLSASWISITSKHKAVGGTFDAQISVLSKLVKLCSKGILKPNIDKSFDLKDTAIAHAYVDTGRKKGIVLIEIDKEI